MQSAWWENQQYHPPRPAVSPQGDSHPSWAMSGRQHQRKEQTDSSDCVGHRLHLRSCLVLDRVLLQNHLESVVKKLFPNTATTEESEIKMTEMHARSMLHLWVSYRWDHRMAQRTTLRRSRDTIAIWSHPVSLLSKNKKFKKATRERARECLSRFC